MRRAPTLAATGFAICMLMGAYGCGGSTELSKAEFVKQADAICKKARNKMLKSVGENGDVAPAAVTLLNSEADEIDALDGPSSGADQIEAIVDGAREAADAVEANEKDPAKAEPRAERTEKLADDYGLKECLIS